MGCGFRSSPTSKNSRVVKPNEVVNRAAGIVFLHGTVEKPARRGDFLLKVGELSLPLLEGGVGLEIRIGLRQREQLAPRSSEQVLGGGPGLPACAQRSRHCVS